MKNFALALFTISIVCANADGPVSPSTAYTRDFLYSPDAGTARSKLVGFTMQASATNQTLWTPTLMGGNLNGVTGSISNPVVSGGAIVGSPFFADNQTYRFSTNLFIEIAANQAIALQNSEPPQKPPLGINSYSQVGTDPTYSWATNAIAVMKSTGLWPTYDLMHIDSGWATNVDQDGHMLVDTNLWPNGMAWCVSNLVTSGFKVGFWTGGSDQSPFGTVNEIGNPNSTTLKDELGWGATEFYLQFVFNPTNLPPTQAPDTVAGFLPLVNTILTTANQPVWIFGPPVTFGLGKLVKEFGLWTAYNEVQIQLHDPFDTLSSLQNMQYAVTNHLNWWIHQSHNFNFGDVPPPTDIRFNSDPSRGGFENVLMWLAKAAVTSSAIFVPTLSLATNYVDCFTNADVLLVDQDAAMCAWKVGDKNFDWPTAIQPARSNNWCAIYKPLGSISSPEKAICVMSFSTNIFASIVHSDYVAGWTNFVLNWTNYGYTATQPLIVKDCFFPHYGNWGRGYYGEYRNQSAWPPAYSCSIGAFTNVIAGESGDLLIVKPLYSLGYHGEIDLINIAPWREVNDGTESSALTRSYFQGSLIAFPTKAGVTNSITEMTDESASFYVPGATNLSGFFGLNNDSVMGAELTNNLYGQIFTNDALAFSAFAGSTNGNYTSSAAGVYYNIPLSGVSNITFRAIGTNTFGAGSGYNVTTNYFNRAVWISNMVTFP